MTFHTFTHTLELPVAQAGMNDLSTFPFLSFVSFVSFIGFNFVGYNEIKFMRTTNKSGTGDKTSRIAAAKSRDTLSKILDRSQMPLMDIRFGRMVEKIKIPRPAVELLNEILKNMSNGIPVTLTPMVKVLTTREAAELLGCSRPHLVKLLETGQIEFVKIGKHRRIKYADLRKYLEKRKSDQKKQLISIMAADEEAGLYDV